MQTAQRTPSRFQAAIYTMLLTTSINIFIDAVAGSGKTTSLEEICARLTEDQRRSSIFLAFSKSIQLELEKRLPNTVWVRTFHSVAMACLRRAVKPSSQNWVNDKKYSYIIDDLLDAKGYPRLHQGRG